MKISYIFGAVLRLTDPIVSDIFSNIKELLPANFDLFVHMTSDNPVTFVMAFVGLFLLLTKYNRHMILVLLFIIIGALSFKIGVRYTIYIAPFLGMGIAYIVYLIVNYLSSRYTRYKKTLIISGMIFTIFISFPAQVLYYKNTPSFIA